MPESQRAFTAETDPRIAQYRSQLAVVQDDLKRLRLRVSELEAQEKTLRTNLDGVEGEYDEKPRCKTCGNRWIAHAGHNGQSLFRPRERGMCSSKGPGYYYEES